MTDDAKKPLTLFGLPVVESRFMPEDTVIVIGTYGQRFRLVRDGERIVGEPIEDSDA